MIYSGLLHLPLFYPDVHMPLITNFSLILLFLFVLVFFICPDPFVLVFFLPLPDSEVSSL